MRKILLLPFKWLLHGLVRLLFPRYMSMEDIVDQHMHEPHRSQIMYMIDMERAVLQKARGSTNNHQAWPGGWWDHITDMMNIILVLYWFLSLFRPLPFSLHDALVGAFAHDIEKPWKYDFVDGEYHHKSNFKTKEDADAFRASKLKEYEIDLTILQANAMKFAEGELEGSYSNRQRAASELAGFVHIVDHMSARLWHNYPTKANDPWKGAKRIAA